MCLCLWGCLQKRLVFESVDWAKRITFTKVDRHYPIHLKQKDGGRVNLLCLLELKHTSSLALKHQRFWLLHSDWDLDHQPPQFSGAWIWIQLHHQLSQFSSLQTAACGTSWSLKPCEPISIMNTHILLVLFLWRTLTNTVPKETTNTATQSYKLHEGVYGVIPLWIPPSIYGWEG